MVGGGSFEGAAGNRTDAILVSGLRAGAVYVARSRAVNLAGVSPASAWSAPIRTASHGGVPGPVGGAAVAANGSESVLVAWTAPHWRGGLPVEAYAIRVVEHNAVSGLLQKTGGSVVFE